MEEITRWNSGYVYCNRHESTSVSYNCTDWVMISCNTCSFIFWLFMFIYVHFLILLNFDNSKKLDYFFPFSSTNHLTFFILTYFFLTFGSPSSLANIRKKRKKQFDLRKCVIIKYLYFFSPVTIFRVDDWLKHNIIIFSAFFFFFR